MSWAEPEGAVRAGGLETGPMRASGFDIDLASVASEEGDLLDADTSTIGAEGSSPASSFPLSSILLGSSKPTFFALFKRGSEHRDGSVFLGQVQFG